MTQALCRMLTRQWLEDNSEKIESASEYIEDLKLKVDKLSKIDSVKELIHELKDISVASCLAAEYLEGCIGKGKDDAC
jgi:hypothetical protein